jgi:hypothetical protein
MVVGLKCKNAFEVFIFINFSFVGSSMNYSKKILNPLMIKDIKISKEFRLVGSYLTIALSSAISI